VGLVDWSETLDFFFFCGVESTASVFGSVESVVASAFSVDCCLVSGDDAPGFDSDEPVDEAPDPVDDDPDPDVAPVSADATPCPTRTAAPIPRATASPPIRPTHAAAPMHMCIPSVQRARPQLGRIGGRCCFVLCTSELSAVMWEVELVRVAPLCPARRLRGLKPCWPAGVPATIDIGEIWGGASWRWRRTVTFQQSSTLESALNVRGNPRRAPDYARRAEIRGGAAGYPETTGTRWEPARLRSSCR